MSYDAPNIPRDETSKIREFILNELTEAAAILPEKYAGSYPNEKGRMTKYAALAVKARCFCSAIFIFTFLLFFGYSFSVSKSSSFLCINEIYGHIFLVFPVFISNFVSSIK